MRLEFDGSGFVVFQRPLRVHVSGLAHRVPRKDSEIRDGQKKSPWESCVDKVDRCRSVIHADKRWFHWPSAGQSAGLGDHFAVR